MSPEEITRRRAWIALGLTDAEYGEIVRRLGRAPNWTELGIFSVLWSEHCAYKHSRPYLKDLPTEGPAVLVGPGENAGVVDVGDGLAIAFRIESHNHPVAVEPFQGAATGIGGILRDILAMGARPIALLDSLRFGPPESGRTGYLFGGVVSGIAHYGNSVGVPTVGGEIYFDESYRENPLCNVMAVGLLRKDQLTRGVARGVGNALVLIGSPTGRDGIHGATFASAELDEHSEERRPSVQVGDPFREKILIEASLELLGSGAVVGLQDLGAAGLASSTAETAARAGSGVEIDLDAVPRREQGMTAYELMLSETQERMLAIVERSRVAEALAILAKWELPAAVIGRVTDDGMLRVREGGEIVAEIPAALLGEAPTYRVAGRPPAEMARLQSLDPRELPEPADWGEVLHRLAGSPNLASRADVYGQYDYQVQTNTVEGPGVGAAVLRLRGTRRGIAVTADGPGRYVRLDPRRGAMVSVAEAFRNLTAVGARPLGLTNCLNFGNPEKPEVAWQFQEAVAGLAEAARELGVPVTGGNVSFYNESPAGPVDPTPVIGMVGVIEDLQRRLRPAFSWTGDLILLLGETRGELGGSEYLREIHGRVAGRPPAADPAAERAAAAFLLAAAERRLLASAQDLSEGGLWQALLECAGAGERGAEITVPEGIRPDLYLFGEDQGRYLLSAAPDNLGFLLSLPEARGVEIRVIGRVHPSEYIVRAAERLLYRGSAAEFGRLRREALKRWFS